MIFDGIVWPTNGEKVWSLSMKLFSILFAWCVWRWLYTYRSPRLYWAGLRQFLEKRHLGASHPEPSPALCGWPLHEGKWSCPPTELYMCLKYPLQATEIVSLSAQSGVPLWTDSPALSLGYPVKISTAAGHLATRGLPMGSRRPYK